MSDTHGDMNNQLLYVTVDDNMGDPYDLQSDESAKERNLDTNSVCLLFKCSLRRYQSFLRNMEKEELRPTHSTSSVIAKIKDEFSRLRVWGEQTCAILPQNARRSLDQQLRGNVDAKQIVIRSLRRLDNHLERGQISKHIVPRLMADDRQAIKQTDKLSSIAAIGTEGERHSSSSDESDTAHEDAAGDARLRKITISISDAIRSLYRISTLLRWSRSSGKYLKSSKSTVPSRYTLEATLDYSLISEKIRQWRHSDEGNSADEMRSQPSKEGEYQEIEDIVFFCQRLTWANLRRREQLEYWADCPDVPEPQDLSFDDAATSFSQLEDQTASNANASLSQVVEPASGISNNEEQRPTVSVQAAINYSNTQVLDPVADTSECSLCHLVLDSKTMQRRGSWKEHVFQDLRPFVCSFERCPDPGRLFITRHDWIYHEQQIHRRKWVCPEGCAIELLSKTAMVRHLLIEHSNTVSESEASSYADLCEKNVDDAELTTCLICLKEMSLLKLYDHLATHMEEIALFVLPSISDEENDEEGFEEENEQIESVKTDTAPETLGPTASTLAASGLRFLQLVDLHRQRTGRQQNIRQQLLPLQIAGLEKHYQAASHKENEKQAAEDRAKKEERVRIDPDLRTRLGKLGWSQNKIEKTFSLGNVGMENKHVTKSLSGGSYLDTAPYIDDPPAFPRISRKLLDIETIEHYHVPYAMDDSDENYVIVLIELEEHETDVLFEHTRRRRHGRQRDDKRGFVPESERAPDAKNVVVDPVASGEMICICGMHHDDGHSVQCDACQNRQHKICYYPDEADQVPEYHYCLNCQPRMLDKDKAQASQTLFLNRYRTPKESWEN